MNMPERHVNLDFVIDTNRINAKTHLKNMNILERWKNDDVISLEMPEVAQKEAFQGGNANRADKARSYVGFIAGSDDSPFVKRNKIAKILYPSGIQNNSQRNDVEIVFTAGKRVGWILITDDGDSKSQPAGILGNKDALDAIGIKVMRDHEAVELVQQKIMDRDEHAKRIAQMEGKSLPEWVGKDVLSQ